MCGVDGFLFCKTQFAVMHTLTALLASGYLLSAESTPERDQYFRCGVSGDVFELMERMDGLSFMESVSLLLKRPAYSFLLS